MKEKEGKLEKPYLRRFNEEETKMGSDFDD